MATIKGKWKWNKILDFYGCGLILSHYACNFESNGEEYFGFYFSPCHIEYIPQAFVEWGDNNITACESNNLTEYTCTMKEGYRLIDFDEQEIDDDLYNFIIANAEVVPQTIAEKLQVIAENEQRVFDAGKKSEYDAFWDRFQSNGTKVWYDNAFSEAGNGYTCWEYGVTYKPKYPIQPISAMNMYQITRLPYEAIAEVDFSKCTDFYGTFQYGVITHLPSIDLRAATRTSNIFGYMNRLEIIDELKVAETTPFQNCFNSCTNLKEIRFTGTIGQNGLNFTSCTLLSHDSLMSIINALKNYSQDTSETWTVTLGADNLAKLTDDEKKMATNKGWSLV